MIANARPKSLYGKAGAVVSGHHLASLHAQQCMAAGGSLVDAMVTASAVLAVVLPHASSLGGCAMMICFDAQGGQVHALNGTGRAPLAAHRALFDAGMPQRGARAAVVPTLVRLWPRAHARFGRIPLRQLLAPAIRLADEGIAAPEELVRNLALADARVKAQPGFAEFMLANGRALAAGEGLVQSRLADVLRAVADEGEQGFYAGPAAQSLVRFSRDNGGLFAPEDFARAQADWVHPWSASAGQCAVHVMPPNSVGALMLAQLDRWERAGRPAHAMDMPAAVQAAIAAIAQGRNRIGDLERTPADPSDFGVPTQARPTEQLPAFRASRAGVGDTTGFVGMDAQGNALAMLQSVFQPFGCGAVDGGTGILLNNRMFDFSNVPGDVNAVAPGVRPSHTLNPWLALDETGRACLAGVSPGGVSQTTTGYQIATGALGSDLTLGELVGRPRWSLSRDGAVLLESGIPGAVAQALRDTGLEVQENSQHEFYFGSAKAVRRTGSGAIEAAGDNRGQATALAW